MLCLSGSRRDSQFWNETATEFTRLQVAIFSANVSPTLLFGKTESRSKKKKKMFKIPEFGEDIFEIRYKYFRVIFVTGECQNA
jgi:hypothetical protein